MRGQIHRRRAALPFETLTTGLKRAVHGQPHYGSVSRKDRNG